MNNNVDNASPQLAQIPLVKKTGNLKALFSTVINKFRTMVSKIKSGSVGARTTSFETSRRGQSTFKKYLPYAIIGIFVLVLLGIVGASVFSLIKNKGFGSSGISVLDAKARQELNREFSFPI